MIALVLLFISTAFSDAFKAINFQRVQSSHTKLAYKVPSPYSLPSDTHRRSFLSIPAKLALATTLTSLTPNVALARLDPVNRPDLLPKEPNLNVIQIEKFLTSGQVKRMNDMLTNLERDTGFRLRVLCQSYPNTPGLGMDVILVFSLIYLLRMFYKWKLSLYS